MGRKYIFEVPGRPVPKERPRLGRGGNIYTPKKTKEYEQLVGWRAKQAIKKPINGDVAVNIVVYVKNNVYPDLDNIGKSILDGLQGIAYRNDRQVSIFSIQRVKGEEEKVEIELEEVGQMMSIEQIKNEMTYLVKRYRDAYRKSAITQGLEKELYQWEMKRCTRRLCELLAEKRKLKEKAVGGEDFNGDKRAY